MKAWILHDIGDFQYEDVPLPQLKNGEALVKIQCAGICSSDVQRVFVTGTYNYPVILGHEFAGIVADVYDREQDAHWIGKHVSGFPLIPCFKCESCISGKYETCHNYTYIGSRQNGAFAEYVAVPVWNLIESPDTIDFETMAMLEPATVALHAVKLLDLEGINSAAVIGTGTIGHLIARWLEIYGVNNVKLIGRGDDLPHNFDVCFEAVGSSDALQNCIKSVRPGAQLVLVGNPSADFQLERNTYWQILRKQLILKGSWNARFPGDWQETIATVKESSLRLTALITHRYEFSELGKAIEMMRDRSEFKLKVIIRLYEHSF